MDSPGCGVVGWTPLGVVRCGGVTHTPLYQPTKEHVDTTTHRYVEKRAISGGKVVNVPIDGTRSGQR